MSGRAFGWIDARLRRGWLELLPPDALATYVFLCLAADRQGVSFYRRDLVAYAPFSAHAVDGFHQVLALPAAPPDAAGNALLVGFTPPR